MAAGAITLDVAALDLADEVIADRAMILREVLLADEGEMVADRAQRVEQVLRGVIQGEAAVGQAEHPAVVRVLPRQQAGAAG